MKFILPLPPTLNRTYKTATQEEGVIVGGRYIKRGKSRMYKAAVASEWQNTAFFTIKEQRFTTIEGPAIVVIRWMLKYDRDVDAGEKLLLDVLQLAKVIQNDNKFVTKLTEKYTDKQNPRVEVYVKEDINRSEFYKSFIEDQPHI